MMPVQRIPGAARAAAGLVAALLGLGAASSANEPPAVVFKTRPRADGGVISGRGPLDVMFNMCPTSDADPGDQLKFTYDFNGDGAIDYYGHCRQGHRYPVSSQCVDAVVCATDRNFGHRQCRTYSVCSSGAGPGTEPSPGPTPTPSPSPTGPPDILPSTYDLYAFTAAAGTEVDVAVDTVDAATAFDAWACLSTTPEGCVLFDENVIEWGDDDQACTFPPPSYACPAFVTTLPDDDDGIYYLLVSDNAEDDFAGSVGHYSLQVGSDTPIGPLNLQVNNQPDDQLPSGAAAAAAAGASSTSLGGGATTLAATPGPAAPAARVVAPAPSAAPKAAPSAPARPAAPPARPAARPERPAAAPAPGGSGTVPAIVSTAGPAETGGRRPEAVFKTDPKASQKGRIAGGGSFEVTFDLCASTDPDAGDELTFTFDFDGDGTVDRSGGCRETHRFEFTGAEIRCVAPVACVGDGRQDHQSCRTYTVCGREGATIR
jgi:hypothetical protein